MDILLKADSRGYIVNRESFNLEYKKNFQMGDSLLQYIKTLVGMANNKGGSIVFGINDSPHIPLGMTNNRFKEIDPAEIDRKIRDHFSQEINWKMEIVNAHNVELGVLSVEESYEKPVLCKKVKNGILREGAIYYRYRAETKEIEYAELKNILDKEREKERILWIKHIDKIATVGPRNVHLLDSYKGEVEIGNEKVIIDESILKQINFIKEGHFTEKDGAPTLKLIGNVSGVISKESTIPSDELYPLRTKDLQDSLCLNSYQMQSIIYKLKIKEKPKYHTAIANGRNTIHKYGKNLVDVLQKMLKRPDFLNICENEYSIYNKANTKSRKRKKKVRR
ncbi:MAG: ATP-binding protein [Bacteroidales bacterium]|nr:ATP-binding protein [Bacteroidales bacterium]